MHTIISSEIKHPPGKHIIVDLWDAQNLSDLYFIEHALCNAVRQCHATTLETKFHQFGD